MTELMPSAGSAAGSAACPEMSELIFLYVCDEVDAQERAAVEAHVRECSACAAALASERAMLDAIVAGEPAAADIDRSGVMLARSRSELGHALDEVDEARRERRSWLARVASAAWLPKIRSAWALHPAASSIVLLGLGFALGVGVPTWVRLSAAPAAGKPAMVVNAAPRLSEQALQNVGSVGLNYDTPDGALEPRVQLQLNSDNPMQLEGSADDADVERVLAFVVANGQRFDPGVLLDSVDLLAPRVAEPAVRQALCVAARTDPNPGVRLKAIEALRGYGRDAQVQQVLLDALGQDDNSGVRIEAVNALRAALSGSGAGAVATQEDSSVVQVLRRSAESDANHYVRLTAASALQEIGTKSAASSTATSTSTSGAP